MILAIVRRLYLAELRRYTRVPTRDENMRRALSPNEERPELPVPCVDSPLGQLGHVAESAVSGAAMSGAMRFAGGITRRPSATAARPLARSTMRSSASGCESRAAERYPPIRQ
jgi:hypothetical protein